MWTTLMAPPRNNRTYLLTFTSWCTAVFRVGHLISFDIHSWLRLLSANRHQLIVPRCRLNTYGSQAFSVAGPPVWNSVPDELRDPACMVLTVLTNLLWQSSLVSSNVTSALEDFLNDINPRCTLLYLYNVQINYTHLSLQLSLVQMEQLVRQ